MNLSPRIHYVEYLCDLIIQNKLEVVSLMELGEVSPNKYLNDEFAVLDAIAFLCLPDLLFY